jgi:hypothetical protein
VPCQYSPIITLSANGTRRGCSQSNAYNFSDWNNALESAVLQNKIRGLKAKLNICRNLSVDIGVELNSTSLTSPERLAALHRWNDVKCECDFLELLLELLRPYEPNESACVGKTVAWNPSAAH